MNAGTAAIARYDAASANAIETKWQQRWEERGSFITPNPGQPGFERFQGRAKQYILDMFPYPSGVGLHVGHPLGYIATDIYARYLRAKGYCVLHAMGYDAFGLPAEQFAVEHGVHPRITTERNIATMRAQLKRLGLAHDPTRSVSTTDVAFYRWTQWIFLQIYHSWYDAEATNPAGTKGRARPIAELVREFESGRRALPAGHAGTWSQLSEDERRAILDDHRLAYLAEVPVNWCPALGTVLANEEVTADGRSERGNHPVYKRPLKQWMMRITAYAERLLDDLDPLAWPESTKLMQRNWIGRSEGAYVDFPAECGGRIPRSLNVGFGGEARSAIRVFTTRPDTLFGATYMVLAPEHPLVDALTAEAWPEGTPEAWKGGGAMGGTGVSPVGSPREAVAAYRRFAESRSEVQRQAEAKEKTGVFIGSYAINPATNKPIPIFIADYVLMGYGTGAIMAVPAQDDRDWDFAKAFNLPIVRTVQPPVGFGDAPFLDDGPAINSDFLNGLQVADAKKRMIAWLEEHGHGVGTVNYKLRDWLFSRQRYWGEPFPIIYDEQDRPIALPEEMLPVELPPLDDFTPAASDDPNAPPQPPLGRARDWLTVQIDGRTYRRELNTMPQWAGSCWYYLRYLDPNNNEQFVNPRVERFWMLSARGGATATATHFNPALHHLGGVDLYVGGVEHAVLHLLYARFWHKVLFDLGHVSTPEPFGRLFNQGYIQAFAYTDERGVYVPAEEVEERDGRFYHKGKEVTRSYGKMGKSLKNALTPDDIFAEYGCDTLRLYEMYMGPLDQSKPWNTRDIIGSHRFLQRVWRNFIDGETGAWKVVDEPLSDDLRRNLHRAIAKVDEDMRSLRFNTAIAALIEFNNALVGLERLPREAAEALVKMLAPLVPHLASELWERLGHSSELMYEPFPEAEAKWLVDDQVEIAVQIMGKLRGTIMVPNGADEATAVSIARASDRIASQLEGKTIRKVVYVPNRLLNFVAN
ncbi:MAG: leucine--tRNA ligase [Phycisphaerales bacterium]|nr:leucine--tRNA ligase [Phycisphaerales bacterium]